MKNRDLETLKPIFDRPKKHSQNSLHIFTAPTDIGVIRNKGRNGARFAPKSILASLKKLQNHLEIESIKINQTTNTEYEIENFNLAQNNQAILITENIQKNNLSQAIHLGGGHDHVFPFLLGIQNSQNFDNIIIINIDAHCDTRVDEKAHSGTPFRNFDQTCKIPTHLIQYGIHNFSNSQSTLSKLDNITTDYIFYDDIRKKTDSFQTIPKHILNNCPFEITSQTAFVFSLDCDAISSSTMKGVSAVNPLGLPFIHLFDLLKEYQKTFPNFFFGIYEYNPVYDDLSSIGSKAIASLLYKYIEDIQLLK
ncbi:MAG: arginase family protein [Bacteriovoracaceae bacterium]|jgi:formiminoglutamase|nr:hypothetical protein [Halobacteriovoraceae bacterium]MDP7321649.1 arginase family protein [Bacteriovoracaceae bacterium]